MELAVTVSSLPHDFGPALDQIVGLGFSAVDLEARANRPEEEIAAIAHSGLLVRCCALGRQLPPNASLEAQNLGSRQQAVAWVKRQIEDSAWLGAREAYLVPGQAQGPEAAVCFADSLAVLADYAAGRKIQLCLEPFPGRALATMAQTRAFLETFSLSPVKILLDVGHCLISREDPVSIISTLPQLLGYLHLNDNDGVRDCHWPLMAGLLSEAHLKEILRAWDKLLPDKGLALELKPAGPDPVGKLRESKAHLDRVGKILEEEKKRRPSGEG